MNNIVVLKLAAEKAQEKMDEIGNYFDTDYKYWAEILFDINKEIAKLNGWFLIDIPDGETKAEIKAVNEWLKSRYRKLYDRDVANSALVDAAEAVKTIFGGIPSAATYKKAMVLSADYYASIEAKKRGCE